MAGHLSFLKMFVLAGLTSLIQVTLALNDKDVTKIAEANNRLALDLHKSLSEKESGNIIMSPFSISTALAMLLYGARGDSSEEMYRILGYDETGLTEREVHSVFHKFLKDIYNNNKKEYALYIANALLTQQNFPIETKYKEDLQKLYLANAKEVDFAKNGEKVVEEINQWASENTNNKITKFLSELDPSTVMVLLNAIYFKGTWQTEFDPELTATRAFYNNGEENSQSQVETMYLRTQLPYVKLGGVKILELPYKGNDVSMVIFLPDSKDGLPELESALQANLIRDVRHLMKKTEVEVYLPKFKIEYETQLKSTLQDLGMNKIFEDEADLRGISQAGNLQVSEVAHKAVIEVNEEGSEAAGVTGVVIENRMGFMGSVFNADHPFLFVIIDRSTDMIYFQGRVVEL